MPIPVLKLNLAPPPTLWRQKHETLGWAALVLGGLCLAISLGTWGFKANQARKAGEETVRISKDAQAAVRKQQSLIEQLRSVDVTKELPRWKLAERIFSERTLAWSRLTAELERSLVSDVRLKTIQKVRGSDQHVSIKLKGEARSREAEEKLMASLKKDDLFQQVILEREAERNGGGVDFEINLPVVSTPSPYQVFPQPEKPKAIGALQLGQPVKGLPPKGTLRPSGNPAPHIPHAAAPRVNVAPVTPMPQTSQSPSVPQAGQPNIVNPRAMPRPDPRAPGSMQRSVVPDRSNRPSQGHPREGGCP